MLDELNAQLRPHGLRFAPDISTASRATIGGMMANNSSGARSVLYGKTIDHVLEQEVVLSDGSVVHVRPARCRRAGQASAPATTLEARVLPRRSAISRHDIATRSSAGFRRSSAASAATTSTSSSKADRPFNLAKLMVGSEGTLGVVLSAKLNLVPLPEAKAVLAIQFASLLESLAATPLILRHGPSAVEVMDKSILDYTRQSAALEALRRSFIEGDPGALLCVEFYADRAEDLPPRLAGARARPARRTVSATAITTRSTWRRRPGSGACAKPALGLSMAMKDDAKSLSFVEDTAVAPEQLRDYIERFLAIVQRHGTTAGVYAHASVGCLHVRPVVNLKTEAGVRRFEAIANDVADLVLEFGGALSGEHGDGLVRSPFMEKMFGPALYEAFRTIKRTFDPHGIFNPGKIVDAPPLTANLRFGAGYSTPNAADVLRLPRRRHRRRRRDVQRPRRVPQDARRHDVPVVHGDARGAALDARPRQRAAADDGRPARRSRARRSRRVRHARSLPRVPRVQGRVPGRRRRGPLQERVPRRLLAAPRHAARRRGCSATCAPLAEWGSRLAPLSNWIAEQRRRRRRQRTRARHRSPPPAAAVQAADARAPRAGRRAAAADALLFNDTFTNHYDPEIGLAALDVLAAAGVRAGAGAEPLLRPAADLEGPARRRRATMAARNADALYADAAAGRPLVFCEPSCLSAVREDAPALLRGEARRKAEVVAEGQRALRGVRSRRSRAATRAQAGPDRRSCCTATAIRSRWGSSAPAKALLSRIPGATVVDLDAGCCGMAGSFGYAREHYDVSRAIGERKLFPAVRAESRRAPSSSRPARRAVIRSPTSRARRAVHPAVLLRLLSRHSLCTCHLDLHLT